MPSPVSPGQLGMATPFWELVGTSDAEMNEELADYVKLGVDWVRLDFYWGHVQPTATSPYNWSLVDKVVNAIRSHGIEVVATLGVVPDWAGTSLSTTFAQQAYANFAEAAAQHFGERVNYWQIMNEPNSAVAGISPVDYTKALKLAYAGIKAVDAGDTVISAGLSPVPTTANGHWGAHDYLKQVYQNGGKNYFDAVGYHPYTYPLMPSNTADWNGWDMMEDRIRPLMVTNGDSAKQIWMTEFGAPTGGPRVVTQSFQSSMLREATDIAHRYSWAGPIMYYSYKDRGDSGSSENFFGLISANGTRKAAYYTYQSIATQDGISVDSPDASPSIHKYTTVPMGAKITDFVPDDIIDLSAIDANRSVSGNQSFTFIGSNWLKKAGDLGFYQNPAKGVTTIQAYLDGDTTPDLEIVVSGIHSFEESDFRLSTSEVFRFTSAQMGTQITTYNDGDIIDLSAIDANRSVSGNQSFTFIGSNWLKKAGDLGFYQNPAKGVTTIQAYLDDSGGHDISLVVAGLHVFTAADFIL